jgi:hypothetical protein
VDRDTQQPTQWPHMPRIVRLGPATMPKAGHWPVEFCDFAQRSAAHLRARLWPREANAQGQPSQKKRPTAFRVRPKLPRATPKTLQPQETVNSRGARVFYLTKRQRKHHKKDVNSYGRLTSYETHAAQICRTSGDLGGPANAWLSRLRLCYTTLLRERRRSAHVDHPSWLHLFTSTPWAMVILNRNCSNGHRWRRC